MMIGRLVESRAPSPVLACERARGPETAAIPAVAQICAGITHSLVIYAQYVVTYVILLPWYACCKTHTATHRHFFRRPLARGCMHMRAR